MHLPYTHHTTPEFSGIPLFALIDPFFREPQPGWVDPAQLDMLNTFHELQSVRSQAWGREVWVAQDERPLLDPRKLPYLVRLQGPDDPLISDLIMAAEQEAQAAEDQIQSVFSVGAFIESGSAPETLMKRLSSMWTLRLTLPPRHVRVADPRVFEFLARLLPEALLQQWLGPVARWHLRCRQGDWLRLTGAADDSLIEDETDWYQRAKRLQDMEQLPASFPQAVAYYRKLQLSGVVSEVLNRMQQHSRITNSAAAHSAVWSAVDRALERGLLDDDDLVACAWRTLSDPGFERCLGMPDRNATYSGCIGSHPLAQALHLAATKQRGRLAHLFAQIDSELEEPHS